MGSITQHVFYSLLGPHLSEDDFEASSKSDRAKQNDNKYSRGWCSTWGRNRALIFFLAGKGVKMRMGNMLCLARFFVFTTVGHC